MTKKDALFAGKAQSYTTCYSQNCPLRDNCLRSILASYVPKDRMIINTVNQFKAIGAGGADWGPWAQAIIGILLIVLAVFLAIEGVQTFTKQAKKAQ